MEATDEEVGELTRLDARLELAKLLWAEPERREEARALAERARQGYVALDKVQEAKAAREWLDEHP